MMNRRAFIERAARMTVALAGAEFLPSSQTTTLAAPTVDNSLRARAEQLGLGMVGIGEGFLISGALAEKVDAGSVETVSNTTVKQENTLKKGTEAFLAKAGGNLTIDVAESTRADLRGQVQLIQPGTTQGSFDMVGIHTKDIPERGWMLLHSGTGGMIVWMGKDRVIQYPGGTADHVIFVGRGPYGIANQDTNENRRAQVELTEDNSGNVLWQRLFAPFTGNIGFITQEWFAKEVANAHAASPNRGADGNSRVYVVYHDTNTRFTTLLRNVAKRQADLKGQIALAQDSNTWTQIYKNT
jgi:hypothetical protein